MTRKEEIIYLYYKKHLRQVDIAKKFKVSKSYITKIIKKDKRYFKEKEKRKNINTIKQKEQTKNIIYLKREEKRREYEVLKLQHNQAIQELSHEVRTTTDNNRKNKIINPDSISAKYKYFGCRAM